MYKDMIIVRQKINWKVCLWVGFTIHWLSPVQVVAWHRTKTNYSSHRWASNLAHICVAKPPTKSSLPLFVAYHTSVNSGGESMDWKLCIAHQRTSYSLILVCVMLDLAWSSCMHIIDQRHHYSDVIMVAIASQITSLTIFYATVYSDADQGKH